MRYLSCCSLSRPPPRPRIFPYTTLFRSAASRAERRTGPTRGRSMAVDVVLSGINKYFGANHVVRDVSLKFPALNFVTLLGPSGCGKTTLLRMIAGLESVSSGDIHFGERRINLVRPGQRDVAMVFQNYALYPNMNVYRNIAYGLRVRRTPRAEMDAKVREVAGILEISHLLDRKP